MIKQGLKNYFYNIKYVFTIIGTLALGVIIGLTILVPSVISAVSVLCDDVVKAVNAVELDGNAVWHYLVDSVPALDWSNPLAALRVVLSENWLSEVVNGCVGKLVGNNAEVEVMLIEAVGKCISTVFMGAIWFAVFTVIGLVGGFYFTKWLVRRGIAKRKLRMFILMALVDTVFSAALMIITVWLASLWWVSVFISAIVMVVLEGIVALSEAYIAHGRNKIEFKQIVNGKNIAKLWLTNMLVFLISVAFTVIALLINAMAGIFVGMAFISIAMIVTSLNAEAYVKSLVESYVAEPNTDTQQGEIAA